MCRFLCWSISWENIAQLTTLLLWKPVFEVVNSTLADNFVRPDEANKDLLVRSIGLEPTNFDKRLKLLFLTRLIPLCEQNFNLIELGPRGTGKSYAFQELSPYVILLTGPTTVANLFYNMASGKMGLVGLWDSIAFDEVADLQKMPKEVVTTLKTYCESGTFARGKDALTGAASIALFGNTNQPVEIMVRSSHLFAPMPDVIREDMAFLDRLHFYLPGWEVPKMRMEFLRMTMASLSII